MIKDYRIRLSQWITPVILVTCLISAGAATRADTLSEQLLAQARADNLPGVQALLKQGADINARGEFGDRAVIWGAVKRDTIMVRFLLDKGADPNGSMEHQAFQRRDAEGGTALMFAVRNKDISTIDALITGKANIDEGFEGAAPLLMSVEAGDLAITNRLLAAGANPDARGSQGETALMVAHTTELMGLLLDRGAKIDAVDTAGATALTHAAGVPILARFLIDHGASVRVGWPLFNAVGAGSVTDVHMLLDRGARMEPLEGVSPLIHAVETGHQDIVRLLLDRGAPIDYYEDTHDLDGGTALIKAARTGNAGIVKLLLARGANLNFRAEGGLTPLMHAGMRFYGGTTGAMQALLNAGANIGARDNTGMTAFLWTAGTGDVAHLKLLQARGADRRASNNDGETALMIAVRYANVDTTRFLLAEGANPRARIKKTDPRNYLTAGDTALMLISNDGDPDIEALRQLLGRVPINAVNQRGFTALMHAAKWGHLRAVRILLRHGARVNTRDSTGRTALSWALHNGTAHASQPNSDVVQALLDAGAVIDAPDRDLVKKVLK